MSVRFAILAAAGCMTCSIAASAPLIGESDGTSPVAEFHAPVIGDLLTDPTQSLAFKAVEFADPVVQLATRDDAGLRDAAVQAAPVTGKVIAANPDPCPSVEDAACAIEPRKDRAEVEAAVAASISTAPQTTIGAVPIVLLCLGLAGCLVLGLSPIFRALSTRKQRRHWRAIKSRVVEAARVH